MKQVVPICGTLVGNTNENNGVQDMSNHNHEFKICPGCNYFCTKNEPNVYCPYCGEKLIDKCPVCGEPITTPYANYCAKCGSLYPGRTIEKRKQL